MTRSTGCRHLVRRRLAYLSPHLPKIYPLLQVSLFFDHPRQTPFLMTTSDVQMQIIGCSRTPFAIMSGGHASNPGFSSTTGVHISLKRFNQLAFSADNSTVEVGTGWVRHLSPHH